MTNAEKYKTAKERAMAFTKFCRQHASADGCMPSCPCFGGNDDSDDTIGCCEFCWLDLEAEAEKPLPCPFCGSKTSVIEHPDTGACWVMCENCDCHYSSGYDDTEEAAIAAHNRVARAAKEKEANNGNDR